MDSTTMPHMALARKISESIRMTCFIRGVLIRAKIDPSALLDTNQHTATCEMTDEHQGRHGRNEKTTFKGRNRRKQAGYPSKGTNRDEPNDEWSTSSLTSAAGSGVSVSRTLLRHAQTEPVGEERGHVQQVGRSIDPFPSSRKNPGLPINVKYKYRPACVSSTSGIAIDKSYFHAFQTWYCCHPLRKWRHPCHHGALVSFEIDALGVERAG